MARRRKRARRKSYAQANPLVELPMVDVLVGVLGLGAVGAVGYLAYNASQPAAPAATTPPCNSTGLSAGLCWIAQNNVTNPAVNSVVTVVAQDSLGNNYPVTGLVTASDGVNVTFTPITPGVNSSVSEPNGSGTGNIGGGNAGWGGTSAPQISSSNPGGVVSGGSGGSGSGSGSGGRHGQTNAPTPPANVALAAAGAAITIPLGFLFTGPVTISLASGYGWIATGNDIPPAVGDTIWCWCENTSTGTQSTFTGTVTSVDGANATFTRSDTTRSRQELATSSMTSVIVPYGYLYDTTEVQSTSSTASGGTTPLPPNGTTAGNGSATPYGVGMGRVPYGRGLATRGPHWG